MFNSVARYLWGDAESSTTTNEPVADDVQLEVTQDEDWLVVDAGKQSIFFKTL